MRRSELDLSRIVSCVLVMLIHSASAAYHSCPIDSAAFVPLTIMSTMARGSVGAFFMISGALFISRKELSIERLFRKNVLRLTAVFLVWSALYAVGTGLTDGIGSGYGFFMTVMKGHYHMWFLWAMIFCYLLLPVVHAAIHGNKLEVKYLLFLFFFLGLLMANFNLTPKPTYILHQLTKNLSVDYLPYLGYMVWGYYLAGREWGRKWLWLGPVIFAAVSVAAGLGNVWYSGYKQEADGWLFSYFSLPSFLQATAVFITFLPLKGKQLRGEKVISALSDCTLGVYLVHPMVIAVLNRLGFGVRGDSAVGDMLLFLPALSVICFAGTWLAKKIPILRKIV